MTKVTGAVPWDFLFFSKEGWPAELGLSSDHPGRPL